MFFILGCLYWLSLLIELFAIHPFRDLRAMRKSGTLKVLSQKQERLLQVLFTLQACIMAAQLIIGPIVEDFPVWYTAFLVFYMELLGFGFGGLISIGSILRYGQTRKQKQSDPTAQDGTTGKNSHEAPKQNVRYLYALAAVDAAVGIVLGAACYFAQEPARRILLVVIAVYILVVIPLSVLIPFLIKKRASRRHGK